MTTTVKMASPAKMAVLLTATVTVMLSPMAQSSMINNGNFLRFINTFDENVMLEARE